MGKDHEKVECCGNCKNTEESHEQDFVWCLKKYKRMHYLLKCELFEDLFEDGNKIIEEDTLKKDIKEDSMGKSCSNCRHSKSVGDDEFTLFCEHKDHHVHAAHMCEQHGLAYVDKGGKINDNVNHPKHYTPHPSGIECIEIVKHHNFCVGNAIKYLWRAGLKGDKTKEIEDLKKAVWYINKQIEDLEGGKNG
jgi:hypothetical protein